GGALTGAARLLRHLHPRLRSEAVHGLGEAGPRVLHQEANRRAMRAAAKAMVELLGWADGKRRRFFPVERTQAQQVCTRLAQLHMLANNVDDIDPGQQILDEGIRNHLRAASPRLSPSGS